MWKQANRSWRSGPRRSRTDLAREQKTFQAAKMAVHASMVDRMDQEIGRVLNQIEVMGALENTLVVFASDNGASAEQIIRGGGHDQAPGSAESFSALARAGPPPPTLRSACTSPGSTKGGLYSAHRDPAQRHCRGHVIDLVPSVLDLTDAHPSAAGKVLRPRHCRGGAWSLRSCKTRPSNETSSISAISATGPCVSVAGSWSRPRNSPMNGNCTTWPTTVPRWWTWPPSILIAPEK